MAMFVGTFQHDNGLGEFCQSIASRALTLATNLSVSGELPRVSYRRQGPRRDHRRDAASPPRCAPQILE
jgi:hypothetical protein